MNISIYRANLYNQLCECILAYETILDEKGPNLEFDVEEKLIVQGSPELLRVIWDTLLSNAIKFSLSGGKIRISSVREERDVLIAVRDYGVGMNDEMLSHAFERFYQGDISHSQAGNGLGLSIAQAAARLADSIISLYSDGKTGTKVTVRIRQ